tara:strand:- start:370 stop:651 length:282 start_codon:yes stop_codon:yes gene_type:complete
MINPSYIKYYKCKRPSVGYKTAAERQFAKWSDVSDWEIFFKKQKIGDIYYIGTALVAWGWNLDNPQCKGEALTKKEALWELASTHSRKGGFDD